MRQDKHKRHLVAKFWPNGGAVQAKSRVRPDDVILKFPVVGDTPEYTGMTNKTKEILGGY